MCFEVLLCATSFAFIYCVSWCSCVSDFYCTVGVLLIIVSPTRSAVCFIQIVPFSCILFLHLSLSALVYCWFLDQRELFDSLQSFLPPLLHPIPTHFPIPFCHSHCLRSLCLASSLLPFSHAINIERIVAGHALRFLPVCCCVCLWIRFIFSLTHQQGRIYSCCHWR